MDFQKSLDEFKVMIGFINHYNDKIKMREFKDKNSIILEMLEQNKNDQTFANQLLEAKKETKEFINQLIKTLDVDKKMEASSSENSIE